MASVAAVSNGVGCPLPGVTTIASGMNHMSPETRLRERDDDEQQREVVQPHDRAERQSRGHREDERGALVAAATGPHDRCEETAAPTTSQSARAAGDGRPRSSPTMYSVYESSPTASWSRRIRSG